MREKRGRISCIRALKTSIEKSNTLGLRSPDVSGVFSACSKEEQEEDLAQEPKLQAEWNEEVGDRMVKICIIGQKLNKEEICKDLDSLLD